MLVTATSHNVRRNNGLIVLEGVNGAGKGTARSHIIKFLAQKKLPAIETFEPGDSTLGKTLRPIILGGGVSKIDPITELLLLAADRSAHVAEILKPAILEKKIVICDRYYFSTIAFQGYGRGIDLEKIAKINKIATMDLEPDFVILFDLDPVIGLQRAKNRLSNTLETSKDSFEDEEIEFHKRIRSGFLQIAKESKLPFFVIDSTQRMDKVLREVETIINQYLEYI